MTATQLPLGRALKKFWSKVYPIPSITISVSLSATVTLSVPHPRYHPSKRYRRTMLYYTNIWIPNTGTDDLKVGRNSPDVMWVPLSFQLDKAVPAQNYQQGPHLWLLIDNSVLLCPIVSGSCFFVCLKTDPKSLSREVSVTETQPETITANHQMPPSKALQQHCPFPATTPAFSVPSNPRLCSFLAESNWSIYFDFFSPGVPGNKIFRSTQGTYEVILKY